jgi:hypothetical protein
MKYTHTPISSSTGKEEISSDIRKLGCCGGDAWTRTPFAVSGETTSAPSGAYVRKAWPSCIVPRIS